MSLDFLKAAIVNFDFRNKFQQTSCPGVFLLVRETSDRILPLGSRGCLSTKILQSIGKCIDLLLEGSFVSNYNLRSWRKSDKNYWLVTGNSPNCLIKILLKATNSIDVRLFFLIAYGLPTRRNLWDGFSTLLLEICSWINLLFRLENTMPFKCVSHGRVVVWRGLICRIYWRHGGAGWRVSDIRRRKWWVGCSLLWEK
jgi:hypothetical protein